MTRLLVLAPSRTEHAQLGPLAMKVDHTVIVEAFIGRSGIASPKTISPVEPDHLRHVHLCERGDEAGRRVRHSLSL